MQQFQLDIRGVRTLCYDSAAQQREIFPRAELVYFEDSGHWPFIDNPAAAAAALIPFLQRVVNNPP